MYLVHPCRTSGLRVNGMGISLYTLSTKGSNIKLQIVQFFSISIINRMTNSSIFKQFIWEWHFVYPLIGLNLLHLYMNNNSNQKIFFLIFLAALFRVMMTHFTLSFYFFDVSHVWTTKALNTQHVFGWSITEANTFTYFVHYTDFIISQ